MRTRNETGEEPGMRRRPLRRRAIEIVEPSISSV